MPTKNDAFFKAGSSEKDIIFSGHLKLFSAGPSYFLRALKVPICALVQGFWGWAKLKTPSEIFLPLCNATNKRNLPRLVPKLKIR